MNRTWLIDAVVRQTMVLVAELATRHRSPVGYLAEKVFIDLVRQLEDAGLGQKIIADMFGMALRTYHARVRRFSESSTDRGQTLWIAVARYLQDRKTATRGEVLHRFRRDDHRVVRSVLKDLVENGVLFRSGRGDQTTYRAVEAAELPVAERDVAAAHIALALVRNGPATEAELATSTQIAPAIVSEALQTLVSAGQVHDRGDRFVATEVLIPYEDEAGWEAAVFDHFQAVVTAITTKLRHGGKSQFRDVVGGSTYRFDVWDGHPLESEVLGLLAEARELASNLRTRTDAHSRNATPPAHTRQVVFYVGQTVPIEEEEEK
ncbi:MAG: crosslink repair DNA glycosylase YcaQ family protein [Myxococcota bacterium]